MLVEYPLRGLEIESGEGEKKEKHIYDLYAVADHFGDKYGGHYVAKVLDPIDGNWYQYNDSEVKQMNEDEVVEKYAYVVCYRRRDDETVSEMSSTTS